MKPGAIAIVRENARFELEQSLKAIGNSFDADVKLLVEISVRYHLLASAFLLEDTDQRGFACLLALSGQTDLYLRGQDLSAHPRWLAASHSLPFSDALAAGDLATEGAIFVPGLALLRLAELRGLEIRREYELLPGLARVAAGVVLPGPGEWAHGIAGAGIA